MSKRYNDPFYFAVANPATSETVTKAQLHIGRTLGVWGRPEVLRSELAFTLCRLVETTERS